MAHSSTFGAMMLATIGAVACCSFVLSSPQPGAGKDNIKLPSIFEFESYKVRFEKHYKSHLEEVTRKVYFYAKALAVYVAALAYKMRRSSHYLALNKMSDWSRQELDSMVNKVLAGRNKFKPKFEAKVKPQESTSEHDVETLAVELEEGIRETLKEADTENALENDFGRQKGAEENDFKGCIRQRRRKRDLGERQHLKPRKLSMDQLVQGNAPVQEPAQVLAKVERNPKSNNPQYDEFGLERNTRGLIDQQEDIEILNWALPLSEPTSETKITFEEPKSSFESVKSLLGKLAWSLLDLCQESDESESDSCEDVDENQVKLADELFSDLRESGCLWQPREQGECGSCYAFAGVSLAEFLFCSKTKHLYAFSEQYLIDCGNGRVGKMEGCEGATDEETAKFVHNFGMELLDRYPYVEMDSECPYSNDTDLKTTGYIRMELRNVLYVPVEVWPQVLKRTPILVVITRVPDFEDYAGGVYSGEKCSDTPSHMMLVVGHGREDGQEFWLIRNSYGPLWGDGGYWKLAKSAPERCIKEGAIWATKDGIDFHAEPKLNVANHKVKLDLAAGEQGWEWL